MPIPNGGICTNAHPFARLRAKRPAFFTSTGAGGRKTRDGVLSLALFRLSPTSNYSFRAHQWGSGSLFSHQPFSQGKCHRPPELGPDLEFNFVGLISVVGQT